MAVAALGVIVWQRGQPARLLSGEHVILFLANGVTGEAGGGFFRVVHDQVFALPVREAPAAGGGEAFGVFDHGFGAGEFAGNHGLRPLGVGLFFPGDFGDDGSVRPGFGFAGAGGGDGGVVAEDGADVVFVQTVGDAEQAPVFVGAVFGFGGWSFGAGRDCGEQGQGGKGQGGDVAHA